jgi:hypothetical protein
MATNTDDGPQQVRFKVSIPGLVYRVQGVERGQLVEVPTMAEAQRLYAAGLLQPAHMKEVGTLTSRTSYKTPHRADRAQGPPGQAQRHERPAARACGRAGWWQRCPP